MESLYKRFIFLVLTLSLTLVMTSCPGIKNEAPSLFTSPQSGVEVKLPAGWKGVDGPESIAVKTLTGLVAFNSWGQTDFWAREIITYNPDGTMNSAHYGPADLASQVPDGEAYVALVQIQGPPSSPVNEPGEYTLDDLSGLIDAHDWRLDGAVFEEFHKSDMSLSLEIFCSPTALDKTVEGLNNLLQSWRFR
jgi:hypothetical protein